jgi:hypothetical protein
LHEVGLLEYKPKTNTSQGFSEQPKTEPPVKLERRWRKFGGGNFLWTRDLSENGQKLYRLFLRAVVDKDRLPIIATKQGFDLEAATDELISHDIIDNSDAKIFRLK